jgi:precorrin-2 dehydrogenase/sirohydrochlorin ferrochelatase
MIQFLVVSYYGIFLALRGRACRVVGGGDIALAKVRGLLAAGAEVMVVAPVVVDGLCVLAKEKTIVLQVRPWRPADLLGASLAIAATNDPEVNRAVAEEASRIGLPINVVDKTDLCSFIVPALLQRGNLQVAVSTGGAAPAFAGVIRDRIGEMIGPEYASAVEVLGRARATLHETQSGSEARRAALLRLAHSNLPEYVRDRNFAAIDDLLAEVLGAGNSLETLDVEIP